MSRRFVLLICSVLLLLFGTIPPGIVAQNAPPQLLTQFTLGGTDQTKFPDVDAAGALDRVDVSTNINRRDAVYWTKGTLATAFSGPVRLGDAPGQPDYATTTVAIGPDGTAHVAWINLESGNAIEYRQRPPGAAEFGPLRVVAGGSSDFRVSVDIGVTTDNKIIIVWRVPDEPMQYRVSFDNGATWSNTLFVSDPGSTYGFNVPNIATGPNGQAIVVYMQALFAADELEVYVATWNGTAFGAPVRVSAGGTEGSADPTATISGTGVAYVAWRGVSGGVFFAERQPDGSWPNARLVDGSVFGPVEITADEQNNVSIIWLTDRSGPMDAFFTYRPNGGNFFEPPLEADVPNGTVFNVSAESSVVGSTSYTHAVSEIFVGNLLATRYYLLSGQATVLPRAVPVIENDQDITNRSTMRVAFREVSGEPTQLRWRFDAPPDDANNDSNGWQPFANEITVNLPREDDRNRCQAVNLFTQVRNATLIEETAKSDAILYDSETQAGVRISNPYVPNRAPIFTPALAGQAMLSNTAGAENGHPDYTRIPLVYMEVNGSGDCSGITEFKIGPSREQLPVSYTINANYFANIVALPDAFSLLEGQKTMAIEINDTLANKLEFTRIFTYDTLRPVFNTPTTASAQITSVSEEASIITTIAYEGVEVSDNLFPAPFFWGVWLANSREAIADPANNPDLVWTAVPVSGVSGGSFTVRNWSLGTGLDDRDLTAGEYYVYTRFLDGAGNPSTGVLAGTISLETVTRPKVFLPRIDGN